jgi:HIV Tat-specific factor 1
MQKEKDGVMTVKFRDPLSAQACLLVSVLCYPLYPLLNGRSALKKMNGRFFAGRRIEATLFSGKQRFQRSGGGDEIEGEGDEAEKKRLDDFAQWLLTEGD